MNYIPQAENCMKKGGRIETIDIAKGLGILFSCKRSFYAVYVSISYAVIFFDFRFPF